MLEKLVALERERWQTRRKTLGWVSAAMGSLSIVTFAYVAVAYSHQVDRAVLAAAIIMVPLPLLVGGVAFALGHRWSRYLLWPVFLLLLPAFPFGTAFAAWGLWVLYATRDGADTQRPSGDAAA